ncbi:MAG: beta-ketoacyl-[acyl-carrier-protein] synthase family protein, partial [Saprospiraceae bacterium]|nr:beta-ketoacyl-[acyl-carrier-protein] synthase family protein [Saprospiraceae bacterium]
MKMRNRVVITGLGVAAPNGVGLADFTQAIRAGQSGIQFFEELERLKFSCQIGGQPPISDAHTTKYFSPLQLRGLNSSGMLYGGIAGMEAWEDTGIPASDDVNYDLGVIFGAGMLGADKYRESIYKVDDGQARRLGS